MTEGRGFSRFFPRLKKRTGFIEKPEMHSPAKGRLPGLSFREVPVMDAEEGLPAYFHSFLRIQEGFRIEPDPSRRVPAVMEHLAAPARLREITEDISRLTPREVEARRALLPRCFPGIPDLEDHLLAVYEKYFGEASPLNDCGREIRLAAASALIQAFPYEGLAAFNPTVVPAPGAERGEENRLPVVLGVRSYGEYHRSSISFRTGWVDAKGVLHLDEPQRTAEGIITTVLPKAVSGRLTLPEGANLNNVVLYAPHFAEVGEAWEDLRITGFTDPSEEAPLYLGTFTAFNLARRRLSPCVLLTRDFRSFEIHPMRGGAAEDKDMVFFPRRIQGRYALLSRNDGRNLFFMTSEDPFTWTRKKKIASCNPQGFDAHKMGVCAPPLETEAGWLVLYHGVSGPGQIYALGAMLLDLEDPTKVIARLPYTFHHPFADEPLGMLTSICYTCGALLHGPSGNVVIPYAVNDTLCKAGVVALDELLARLKDDGV